MNNIEPHNNEGRRANPFPDNHTVVVNALRHTFQETNQKANYNEITGNGGNIKNAPKT